MPLSAITHTHVCPLCQARFASASDEPAVCGVCGSRVTVSAKYVTLVAPLVVLASYGFSVLLAYWLTHDIRKFLLPDLE